jgi:hypothetical protein
LRPFFAGFLLALSLASCAKPDPSLEPGAGRDPMAPIDVQALGREVASVRGIALVRPIDAQPLPDAEFVERFFSERTAQARTNDESDTAFWSAFGFAPTGPSARDAARRAQEQSILGFYDARAKKLFLRGARGDGQRIVPTTRSDFLVLSHEIEHALQDQNFALIRARTMDGDEALAHRALLEGDAELTRIGVSMAELAVSEHWVTRATYYMRSMSTDEMMQQQGVHMSELRKAPPLVQRFIVFPYLEGTAFVGDLVRAGGLALLDDAFAHPPRSTEQVLHPQKYVAGDEPVPVTAPQPPEGWRPVKTGTMGELATSVFLAQCASPQAAEGAATGWGGDAWSIVTDGSDHFATLWSTVWDDEAAAARFEQTVSARGACLAQAQLDPRVGRDVHVVRDGKRVAYVQGLPGALQEPTARALLLLASDAPPAKPPFGAVVIPPLVDPYKTFGGRGVYADGHWRSKPLGIDMPVPDGFVPESGGWAETSMVDPSSGAKARLHVFFQAPTAGLESMAIRRAVNDIRWSLPRNTAWLEFDGDDTEDLPGGYRAHVYRWRSVRAHALDLAFVPACDGKATVLLVTFSPLLGRGAIDRWMQAVALPAGDSPACTWLRQARDE